MATDTEVRVLVVDVRLQIERLRRYSTGAAFVSADQEFATLSQELPTDVLGADAATTWITLLPNRQDELFNRLNTIKVNLDELEYRVRAPSLLQKALLFGYATVVFWGILAVVFLCVCKGVAPLKFPAAKAVSDKGDENDNRDTRTAGGNESATENADANANAEEIGTPAVENPRASDAAEESIVEDRASEETTHQAWVYLLLLSLGAFGGTIRLLGSLAKYAGEKKLYRSWLPYYYFMPLEGLGLSFIFCLLIAAGIVTMDDAPNVRVPLYFYGIAGFAGLSAKNVVQKLQELACVLFSKPSTKDAAMSRCWLHPSQED